MGRTRRSTLRRLDEATLIERARSGDGWAADELLRRYEPQVRSVCRRICRSHHDAEDAAQDTLASINVGLRSFDGRSALGTWVNRIATNRALDELRRRHRRPEPVGGDEHVVSDQHRSDGPSPDEPEPAVIGGETRSELATALAALPDLLAEAVVLRDVADLDYATIAEELGVPVGTVRSRISRGRAQLADHLRATPGWNRSPGTDVQGSGRSGADDHTPETRMHPTP